MYEKTKTVENSKMTEKIKDNIILAGAEAFAIYGYDKTTVEDIAKLAHKAKTSIYYYFDGKADIFKAVIDNEFVDIMDKLSALRTLPVKGDPEILRNYLKKRMEILTSSGILRRFTPEQYTGRSGEPEEIVRKARERFDLWEKDYFKNICKYGKELGVLGDNVYPETFADMLEMLLKGVEIQFFVAKDKDASRLTYNEMVDYLIKCNECAPESND